LAYEHQRRLGPEYFLLPQSGSEPTPPLPDAIIAASTLILASEPRFRPGLFLTSPEKPHPQHCWFIAGNREGRGDR
jgi:hypothetical protein